MIDRRTLPSGVSVMAVEFKVRAEPQYSVVHFCLGPEPMEPADLGAVRLPSHLLRRRQMGLIISGRGPVWLHAFLLHEAHPFAWVGTYDPRLGGAVVVARHVSGAPEVGSVIPIEMPEGEEV
jgi:CRISPR-associated protein Csx3